MTAMSMGSHSRARGLRHFLAALIWAFGISSSVHAGVLTPAADETAVGALTAEEEQRLAQLDEQFSKFTEEILKPCILNRNAECRDNMTLALNAAAQHARSIEGVIGSTTARVIGLTTYIRNGQFRYEPVFALRLLNAIVRQGGSCPEWRAASAVPVGGSKLDMATLFKRAESELPKHTRLPEHRQFAFVSGKLTQCGIAANVAPSAAVAGQ